MVCRIFCTVTLLVLYGRVNDANGCGPDPCPGKVCPYDTTRYIDGCLGCECYPPCLNVICPVGLTCQDVQVGNTNDVSYRARCLSTATNPRCPPVSCSNTCDYYESDERGCQTCECWDPCKWYPCEANQRCVLADCFYTLNCRDFSAECLDESAVTTRSARESTTIRLQAQELTLEERFQATMRQCCSKAVSWDCFKNCSTDPTKVLSDFSTCFPHPKIWDYLYCISGSKPSENIWKPSEMNGEIVKLTRPKGRESAGMHHQLGNLIGHVGSKILKYHLNEKEFVQEKETDIEAETKPDIEAEAETEPEILRDVQKYGC